VHRRDRATSQIFGKNPKAILFARQHPSDGQNPIAHSASRENAAQEWLHKLGIGDAPKFSQRNNTVRPNGGFTRCPRQHAP
jgi:hypothetical protein